MPLATGTLAIPNLTVAAYVAVAGRGALGALPTEAWLAGHAIEVRATRAATIIDLVDAAGASAASAAQVRCTLWPRDLARIEATLGRPIDPATLRGSDVVLRVRPSFHARYHLQAGVIDVHPVWAQGHLARLVGETRERLRAAGHLDRQNRLPAPTDVVSIAVVHPDQGAGWGDVEADLAVMLSAGLLTYHSLPARFEGPSSTASLVAALARAKALAAGPGLDAVLVVRGGGPVAGLAALDDEDVARAVALMPIPVITGLGHARDRSLADEAAWHSAHTPSKAVAAVKTLLLRRVGRVRADVASIHEGAGRVARQAGAAVNAVFDQIERGFRDRIAETRAALDLTHADTRGKTGIARAGLTHRAERLDALLEIVEAAASIDPGRRLEDIARLGAACLRGAHARLVASEADVRGVHDGAMRAARGLAAAQRHQDAIRLAGALAAARRGAVEACRALSGLDELVRDRGPAATLRRGFCLALDGDARVIATGAQAGAAVRFELLFADRTVSVRLDEARVEHPTTGRLFERTDAS